MFKDFGEILSVKVFIDKQTRMSKCFGFVSFEKASVAAHAIAALNGYEMRQDQYSGLTKKLKVELKKE